MGLLGWAIDKLGRMAQLLGVANGSVACGHCPQP